MTRQELYAELAAKAVSQEEIERRHPHVKVMNANISAAIRDLQAKGIPDEHGELILRRSCPPI